jgi:MerR family transcriptional regulator/heat shock protein HspR
MADDRPVYMIGIAAELAGMHPQTLRVYERRGLVAPKRSPRGTRLYSEADVQLLLRIQDLSEEGFNLTGIERVLSMERALLTAKRRIERLESEVEEIKQAARDEIVRVKRSVRADLVVVSTETAVVPYRSKDSRQTRGGI